MQTRLLPHPDPPPKGVPPGWQDWPEVDEAMQLFCQEECLGDVLAAMRRIRALIERADMPEDERKDLLFHMRHILKHLTEPLHMMQADMLLRDN